MCGGRLIQTRTQSANRWSKIFCLKFGYYLLELTQSLFILAKYFTNLITFNKTFQKKKSLCVPLKSIILLSHANSKYLPQPTDLTKHKFGSNSVTFTDNELKYDKAVVKSHSQHIFQVLLIGQDLHKTT